MPIYEYACRSCEHQFETIQKSSEEPLKDCPECGETALRKLLSAPVFRLKGSGWYETDFKTGDRRNVTEGQEKEKETEASGNGDSVDKPSDGGTAKESSDSSPAAAESATNTKTNAKGSDQPGGKSSTASGGSSASTPDAG